MNIKREAYLKRIRPFYNKPLIKVLVGQRRVGKSFLLQQIRQEIEQNDPKANIIFIDKEQYKFHFIYDEKTLIDYVNAYLKKSANNYLFIDEVQEIHSFEKALRSLLNERKADIYCTGSNAHIFSAELATMLSGRHMEFKIHPLSYMEFLQFHQLKNDDTALNFYLKYGGLPFLIHLPKEDDIVFEYLKNITSTIIFKDVVNRYDLRDAAFLDDLILFLADNTGNVFSARKIKDYLKSQFIHKSVSSIINYIRYLEQANIVCRADRKEVRGKKIFEVGAKYYFEDLGIRHALVGFRAQDIQKVLENVVYNHLIFCGYSVYIGKSGDKEIDFVAEREGERIYVQVAYLLADEQTVRREFGNLDAIHDHYPKLVVSMDTLPIDTSYKGIQHWHLKNFLMECF